MGRPQITLTALRDIPEVHPGDDLVQIILDGLARESLTLEDGDVVVVRDAGGNFLARGTLNRRSQITVRLLTWDQDQAIDGDFWRARLAFALA